MPFKPNYRHMRAERTRAKELRKQEKLQRRQELNAERPAEPEDGQPASGEPENTGQE